MGRDTVRATAPHGNRQLWKEVSNNYRGLLPIEFIKNIFAEANVVETKIAIEGMSCQHCVMAVKKALGGIPGILENNVQVGSASVKYDESKVSKEDIETTIEKAGYMVKK